MSFAETIADWVWGHHLKDDHDGRWQYLGEALFWLVVAAAHIGAVLYLGWRHAVRFTEASGSSVVVRERAHDAASATPSGDSSLGGSARKRKSYKNLWLR